MRAKMRIRVKVEQQREGGGRRQESVWKGEERRGERKGRRRGERPARKLVGPL